MRESTSPPYIAAFDTAWERFMRSAINDYQLTGLPPSKWEAFAAGFEAGKTFGRKTSDPRRIDERNTP